MDPNGRIIGRELSGTRARGLKGRLAGLETPSGRKLRTQ